MRKILLLFFAVLVVTTGRAQTVKEVRDSVKAATKAGSIKKMASTVKGAFAAKPFPGREIGYRNLDDIWRTGHAGGEECADFGHDVASGKRHTDTCRRFVEDLRGNPGTWRLLGHEDK